MLRYSSYTDQTKTGHCLGRSRSGNREGATRDLSATETALVRALLHLILSAAAIENPAEAAAVETTGIGGSAVFFWEHLQRNLNELQRLLNRSREDVVYLMHSMLGKLKSEEGTAPIIKFPDSKQTRRAWENEIARWMLKPILTVWTLKLLP